MKRFRTYLPTLLLLSCVAASTVYFLVQRAYSVQTLRWAHVYEVSSPYHQEALWAANEFARLTDGKYNIEVYAASSLGNEVSINEAVDLGSIDIIYTGPSLAAQHYPPLAISDYPYAIKDFAHWQSYSQSDLYRELVDKYKQATGDEIVSLIYYGFRHTTSNKPIRVPADMENLKIRVPNARPFMMMPEETGANPAPIPFSEAYLALQQGVVDAQENPLTTIKYKRFYEVQSHINLTGHIANSLIVIAAGKTLSRLGEDDAEKLREVLQRATERCNKEVRKQEIDLLSWYPEQGITVIDSDREAFRQQVLPALRGENMPFTPELLDRLQTLAPQ
ncbi:sialic acid TRAP transporter substrate-binding protein SiaP [Pelagicoccus mobilis]|uniref:Sialic acid TRAP transporter substrate-binding protein SiaP n=1 Tax=Pelagicoccus mobilis TaxID=415221 RepID=A0A934S0W1_9BACT|nr:sialic acid TRAP transporter substrate-binding protein SiaP [Pelagicoccus mobilis]MBK1880286.1 sialic acid TRAP transporter substrate-binding protein SiaP [Pelagicoccus mobilis]